jgi:hypothetical protein
VSLANDHQALDREQLQALRLAAQELSADAVSIPKRNPQSIDCRVRL